MPAGFLAQVAKVLLRFSQVVLPSGSPSLGGTSAGFLAKVAKVLSRFSQVVLPLLVARLLDSWLRLPRLSQGSCKFPKQRAGYSSEGVLTLQEGMRLLFDVFGLRFPRITQGSPKRFSFSWWHVCWILG